MERMFLAPGFRFHPTDVELILYYLKRKIMGKKLHVEAISEIELYKFDPWDLPAKSCLKSGDLEWYFFCPKYRKYSNGPRINRGTEHGYWKTTGVDKHICHNSQTIGKRKTLVFHEGRAPQGRKTNWVMYEYRLEDKNLVPAGIIQDTYVLCKIFEKSGSGPKNGEQYGAPYREEDWEDDEVSHSLASFPIADPCSSSLAQAEEHHPPLRKDTDIVSLLDMFDNDDGATVSNSNVGNEVYAIYKGLPDLGSPSDLKINIHFPGSMETEFTPGAKLLENDKSFLELNDLAYPLDSFAEKNGHLTLDLYACSNDFNNFDGCCDAGLPASELSLYHSLDTEGSKVPDQLPTFVEDRGLEGDRSQGNKTAMCDLASCSVREAEGRQMKDFQQATARGERQTGAYSGLRFLLESLPTYSTSATGFPSPNGGERLKVGSLLSTCSGSTIHVEAEVYVWWECTDEALLESPGEFLLTLWVRVVSEGTEEVVGYMQQQWVLVSVFRSTGFILNSRCQILQVAWNLFQCFLPARQCTLSHSNAIYWRWLAVRLYLSLSVRLC